ncbi:podocalyxin [Poeciliopsis prolifica]|uniref:podocalyxin n=1 Tax=Poeciliopsis prolifica TaxID=188132 RepID=UPI002414545C|nr:podocalyxin [Poeciliopsis prolifica]
MRTIQTLTVTWLLLSLSICSESSDAPPTESPETKKAISTAAGEPASTVRSASATGSSESSNQSVKPTGVAPSTGTTQTTAIATKPPTTAAAVITTITAQSNSGAQISVMPTTISVAIAPATTVSTATSANSATSVTSVTSVTTTPTTVISASANESPASDSRTVLTTSTESSRGATASASKPSESAVKTTTKSDVPTTGAAAEATTQRSQATSTAAGSNEGSNAGPTTQTMTTPSNSNQVPERSITSSQAPTVKDSHVITKSLTTTATMWAVGTETNTETFMFSVSDLESTKNKTLLQLCKSFMSSLRNGTCIVALQNNGSKIGSLMIEVDVNLVQEQLSKLNAEKKPKEEPTDNKTLTAILASCGALLIMIIILGVCVSQRRKPYNENQLHLTEELHTVENGYHDNPTLEVMEAQPEMQEKKMALNGEFSDSWIVPIDNLMKEEAPDEEDTHL